MIPPPPVRRLPPPDRSVYDEDASMPNSAPPVRRPPKLVVVPPRKPPVKKQASAASPPPAVAPIPPLPPTSPPNVQVTPPATPPAAAGPVVESRFVPNEVVFEFKPVVDPQLVDTLISRNRLERIASWKFRLTDSIVYRYRITDGRPVSAVVAALQQDPSILSAQPNYLYTLQQITGSTAPDAAPPVTPVANVSSLPPQYAIETMHVKEAQKLARGANVVVAVIDSAIDGTHPDIAGTVSESFDAVGGESQPDNHGTAMTGAIAAHGRLVGVAPEAHVLAVRAFTGRKPIGDSKASATAAGAAGTTFQIMRGLDWSYEHHARIVNMSFSGPQDPQLSRMISAAHDRKMVILAAAGNGGPAAAPLYPAADPNVIAVTATDPENRLYSEANRGKYVAIAAPGVDVVVDAPKGAFDFSTGTSVATAHASGIAALILQMNPDLDAEGVRKILVGSAHALKGEPNDAGLADALAAVQAASMK